MKVPNVPTIKQRFLEMNFDCVSAVLLENAVGLRLLYKEETVDNGHKVMVVCLNGVLPNINDNVVFFVEELRNLIHKYFDKRKIEWK